MLQLQQKELELEMFKIKQNKKIIFTNMSRENNYIIENELTIKGF